MKKGCALIFMLICSTACSTIRGPAAGPQHVLVNLSTANICFEENCYPALIGKNTPIGTFEMTRISWNRPGYGGDIIKFKSEGSKVYAIHRLWLLRPEEKREIRILSDDPEQRIITKGCINVTPEVYEKLKDNQELNTLIVQR